MLYLFRCAFALTFSVIAVQDSVTLVIINSFIDTTEYLIYIIILVKGDIGSNALILFETIYAHKILIKGIPGLSNFNCGQIFFTLLTLIQQRSTETIGSHKGTFFLDDLASFFTLQIIEVFVCHCLYLGGIIETKTCSVVNEGVLIAFVRPPPARVRHRQLLQVDFAALITGLVIYAKTKV